MHNLSHIFFAMTPPGAGGDAQGNLLASFMPIIIVFGIFYFIVIRPQSQQRKQHEEMLKNLKKGDRIVTSGGLHGTIAGFSGDVLKVRIADQVSVQISRSAVAVKLGEENE